jgi:putative ABC transport system permease protein
MNKLINFFRKRTPVGFLQLKHDPGRLATAVAGVAFADILILMQMGFLNALFDSSVKFHQSLNTDLVMMNSEAPNWTELSTFSRRRLYQAQDIPGVMTTESIYINSVRWKNPQTREKTSILVIGIDPNAQSLTVPEVQENLEKIKLPYTFLFDRGSRGKYQQIISQVQQGEIVTTEIERNTITIGGLFRLGASFGADATLISSQDNFLRLFPKKDPGTVSLGLIRLEPTANPQLVKQNLNAYFADLKDVKVMTLDEFITMEKLYWAANRPVGIIFGFSMVIGFIVGIVIVYQVLSADVNAHLPEYATFQAMGYHYRFLLGIVFEQALILAILGFIPGVTISLGLYSLVRKTSYLPLSLTLFRGTLVFVLTLIMCAISGAIATRQLKYADPADMF